MLGLHLSVDDRCKEQKQNSVGSVGHFGSLHHVARIEHVDRQAAVIDLIILRYKRLIRNIVSDTQLVSNTIVTIAPFLDIHAGLPHEALRKA